MASKCDRCGSEATTLTDDGELLCEGCDESDSDGISSPDRATRRTSL